MSRRYYVHDVDESVGSEFVSEFSHVDTAIDWAEDEARRRQHPLTISNDQGRVLARIEADGEFEDRGAGSW